MFIDVKRSVTSLGFKFRLGEWQVYGRPVVCDNEEALGVVMTRR